jgi:VIT1/CCC1 family predicted Fe2+/Mn2+ transporter/rubrerythrin
MAKSQIPLSKTERNLWNAIVGEALALLKYNAYAAKAMEEGHPEIAQIFQETAGAEKIHGINHLRTAGDVKNTLENLRVVTQGEAREITTRYPRMIREALDEGRQDAARAFTVAMDREKHHLQSFLTATGVLEAKFERILHASKPVKTEEGLVGVVPENQMKPTDDNAELIVDESYQGGHDYDQLAAATFEFPNAVKEVERERLRVAAFGRIKEVVFGAQDGIVSTVALVTAISSSVANNDTVIIAGLAGVLAGMISMATGTYLGSKAEKEVFQAEIENEARELEENPAEEMAELVFLYHKQGMDYHEAKEMAEHIASDRDLWLRTLVEKELGIDPDLTSNPLKDALAMGTTFVFAGFIPIIPYLFTTGFAAMSFSISAALLTLFGLGIVKGRIVQKNPLLQGLGVLLIGVAASALGLLIGEILPLIIG